MVEDGNDDKDDDNKEDVMGVMDVMDVPPFLVARKVKRFKCLNTERERG